MTVTVTAGGHEAPAPAALAFVGTTVKVSVVVEVVEMVVVDEVDEEVWILRQHSRDSNLVFSWDLQLQVELLRRRLYKWL